ncbi:MAG: SDR family oxidoreductase [Christensenella sp.]|nr:SDR family oxidoreductase [Christensenella sp.]
MKALVTGASSGIGREIAKELSQRGYHLILCARRAERLEALREELGGNAEIIMADLSREEECIRVYEQTASQNIEILVNNAGFGVFGGFCDTNLEREINMIDLNITAVHILTKLYLKKFTRENRGYILNVASSAAFMPGPLFSSYYASKAYVLRLTQAIHTELRKAGSAVHISALCPGPVATEFNETAGVHFALHGLSPDRVAGYAVKKMLAGKTVITPGFLMKCARFFSHILPDGLLAKAAYHMQKKKLGS